MMYTLWQREPVPKYLISWVILSVLPGLHSISCVCSTGVKLILQRRVPRWDLEKVDNGLGQMPITTLLLLTAAFPTGAPLFVAFLVINLAGVAIFLGPAAFGMVANFIFDTANYADLATIPLFVPMAEIFIQVRSVDILSTLSGTSCGSDSWFAVCAYYLTLHRIRCIIVLDGGSGNGANAFPRSCVLGYDTVSGQQAGWRKPSADYSSQRSRCIRHRNAVEHGHC